MFKKQELLNRMKNVLQRDTANPPADRGAEIRPGQKFRDVRGREVTLLSRTPVRVSFLRPGYPDVCELSCKEFERKFREVVDGFTNPAS